MSFRENQIRMQIEKITQKQGRCSTEDLLRRVGDLKIRKKELFPELQKFYELNLIDDRTSIQMAIQVALSHRLGFNGIKRELLHAYLNPIQVNEELGKLLVNFNHEEQAMKCMLKYFGACKSMNPETYSRIVLSLQSKGHRLNDIWKVATKPKS